MSRPETPDTAPLPIVPSAEDETARDVEERSAQPCLLYTSPSPRDRG